MRTGRIDVVGLRDLGGRLSGIGDLISVEVKLGGRFANAAGQAHGYSVYAHRCYLALPRSGRRPYNADEVEIATRLNIGLLAITGRNVSEILSAPRHEPVERLHLLVLDGMGWAQCAICRTWFDRGTTFTGVMRASQRRGPEQAAVKDKGYMYWLWDVADRQRRDDKTANIYHRRYLCRDCVNGLFWKTATGTGSLN